MAQAAVCVPASPLFLKYQPNVFLGQHSGTSTKHWVIRLSQDDLEEQVWFLHKAGVRKIVNCLLDLNRTKPVHLPKPIFGSNLT